MQVPGLANALQISAANTHTVTVLADGTVWSWGNNANGQLGDGTTTATVLAEAIFREGLKLIAAGADPMELLANPDRILGSLCEAVPVTTPGRHLAYHAISGGFVLGEIVRRSAGILGVPIEDEAARARNSERFRATTDPAERERIVVDAIGIVDRQVATLRALLCDIEWSAGMLAPLCWWCQCDRESGHAPDCKLAEALR